MIKNFTRNGLLLGLLAISFLLTERVFADTQRQEFSRKTRYECKCQQKYKKKPKKGYIQSPKHKYRYYERPYNKNNCFPANRTYYYAPYYDPNDYYFNNQECCKHQKEPFFYFNK
jgi:hypothetical protein